jgi:hypothetical protein
MFDVPPLLNSAFVLCCRIKWGTKYVIVGQIESPVGKPVTVKTIWIVDKGLDVARLVTAYPRKE